jgi:hypothetical protein
MDLIIALPLVSIVLAVYAISMLTRIDKTLKSVAFQANTTKKEDNTAKEYNRDYSLNYIGSVTRSCSYVDKPNEPIVVNILFFMNDSNKREIRISTKKDDVWNYFRKNHNDLTVWEDGGDFPKDFKPDTDDEVFGRMLQKLMDRKLVGEDQ